MTESQVFAIRLLATISILWYLSLADCDELNVKRAKRKQTKKWMENSTHLAERFVQIIQTHLNNITTNMQITIDIWKQNGSKTGWRA